jgi:pimeloyl-ACP methyl ester carboxylesterase
VNLTETAGNTTAPTQYVTAGDNTFAYRQFGSGVGVPLLFLHLFTCNLLQDSASRDRRVRRRAVRRPAETTVPRSLWLNSARNYSDTRLVHYLQHDYD